MNCKHENTRKLFWSDQQRKKWVRTDVSICLNCNKIVGLQPVEMETKNTEPSLAERTNKALSKKDAKRGKDE